MHSNLLKMSVTSFFIPNFVAKNVVIISFDLMMKLAH